MEGTNVPFAVDLSENPPGTHAIVELNEAIKPPPLLQLITNPNPKLPDKPRIKTYISHTYIYIYI